jgi:hypothetical protein
MPTFPYFYGISAHFGAVPEVTILTKISWGFLSPVAPNPQGCAGATPISQYRAPRRRVLIGSAVRN